MDQGSRLSGISPHRTTTPPVRDPRTLPQLFCSTRVPRTGWSQRTSLVSHITHSHSALTHLTTICVGDTGYLKRLRSPAEGASRAFTPTHRYCTLILTAFRLALFRFVMILQCDAVVILLLVAYVWQPDPLPFAHAHAGPGSFTLHWCS